MANPQCENGYTKIANEILEALIRADLSGQELRITLLVLRKTYGFNKKYDFISLSQMAKALGCLKVRCAQVVKNLESMKILTVNENINYKINNIQKKVYTSDSIEVGLSEKLLSLIKQRNPHFKEPNIQSWAKHIDRMIRIDKRPVDEIEKIIAWCQAHVFWQNNILSTDKLRKQYDRLFMQMSNDNGHVPERQRYC